jgi:hypothetical protein
MQHMNVAQNALHDQLEDEADKGIKPGHPMWAVSATKTVYEMIRDSIKVEDIPYLAISLFEMNFDSVGRNVWLGCTSELNEFAGEGDLSENYDD